MILRVSLLIALLLGSGCRSVITPKQDFSSKHPELRKLYIQLDETSLALIEETANQKQNSIETLLAGVRKRATNDCPSLVAGIDASLRLSRGFHQGDLERIAELKNAFDERTDHLFYYVCKDGEEYERGWLILRHGNVIKKLPLGTAFHP